MLINYLNKSTLLLVDKYKIQRAQILYFRYLRYLTYFQL